MKRGQPRNIRPFEDSLRIVAKLAARTSIDQKQWFAIVLHAGLEAIEGADYNFPMPLKLKVAEPAEGKPVPRAVSNATGRAHP